MRVERTLVVALGLAAVTGACASTGTTGGGTGGRGAASLPQVTCGAGVTLVSTPQATAAQDALNRTIVVQGAAREPFYRTALTQAQAGITADANNPYHHYLAGNAHAGLGNLAGADSAWDRAEQLCPGFTAEIEPAREQAWLTGFQSGLEAYQRGDTAAAIGAWENATVVYDRRPDTYYNLAVVYGQRGDTDRAVAQYRAALAALDRMVPDTSAAGQAARAETRANSMAGLLSAGAQLFQAEKYQQAADVFRQINTIAPNNRDAWYNHALALYKLERWDPLVPVAQRVIELDPLNYNARIILFNAYKGQSEAFKTARNAERERVTRDLALRSLQEADALPVTVDNVTITNATGKTTLAGVATGAAARAGSPVQLEFTVYSAGGNLGTKTVTISAPAKGATSNFSVEFETATPATGFQYRVVG